MNEIENVIFDIAEALRAPVLILALLALAVVLIELGAFIVELLRRRRRDFGRLETASVEARAALDRGDETGAKAALRPVAWSTGMARSLAFMIEQFGRGHVGDRMAKGLADFDFRSLRRLERTRLLVRAGPALGLMGTLIPLSPALEGLANGNTEELSDNLRIAFSVTVLGLLIGAIAFAISLVRDRLYGQDLSDLEFVAATLAPDSGLGSGAIPPSGQAGGPRPTAAPPPPSAGAAAGDKPPPPKDAKPLGAALPPPGGAPAPSSGPGSSAPAPAAPAAAVPAPPPPTPAAPSPDPAAAAAPSSPTGAAGSSPADQGTVAAPVPPPPVAGGVVSASSESAATAAPAPTPSAGDAGGAPPAPMPSGGSAAEASPPAHAPPLPSTGSSQQEGAQPPPGAAPLPPPPIPEPPTQQMPPTAPGDDNHGPEKQ